MSVKIEDTYRGGEDVDFDADIIVRIIDDAADGAGAVESISQRVEALTRIVGLMLERMKPEDIVYVVNTANWRFHAEVMDDPTPFERRRDE